jgi:hypothetical protein
MRAQPTEVRTIVPLTYHADGMLLFADALDRALLALVLEIQRGWDPDKKWSWPLYVADLQARVKALGALVVYCTSESIARRYRRMFKNDGLSLQLRPFIFTPAQVPLIVDTEVAESNPTLAIFAAICNRDDPAVDKAFPALAAALKRLQPEKSRVYYDFVLGGLPQEPATRWEAFMLEPIGGGRWHSQLFRDLEAKGRAEAVLAVLKARHIDISDDLRDQIRATNDADQLDAWLLRAINATTLEDVLAVDSTASPTGGAQ